MKLSLALFQFIILLLLADAPLPAQFKYEYFGIEQGLTQSNARAIVQDKEGFLWIGTWDGLNRYDGYSFKHYQYNPAEKNSLSGGNIIFLSVDNQDRIWISFSDGAVNIFDKKTEEFVLLKKDNAPFRIPIFQFLTDDRKGNYWTVYQKTVYRIETSSLNITAYNSFEKAKPNSLSTNSILLFDVDKIYLVNEKEEIQTLTPGFNINGAYKLKNGNYAISSTDGMLYEFDISSQNFFFKLSFAKTKKDHVIIYSMLEDSQGRLWIAGSIGLQFSENFFSTKEKPTFRSVPLKLDEKKPLGSEVAFSLFEDKSGIIWAGHWTGLFKLHPNRKNFKSIPTNKNYSAVFGNNFPISFYSLKDSLLYIGTTDGFFIYNFKENKVEKFTDKNSQLSSSAVFSIHRDSRQRLWLGTRSGLNLFNPITKNFQSFNFVSKSNYNFSNTIYAIAENKSGELLLGTAEGLIKFNPETKFYTHYLYKSNIKSEGACFILSLLIDKNILWAGTNGEGLLKINLDDFSFKRFALEEGDKNSLSHNKVMALHIDKKNRLWAATLGGGLNLLQPDEITFKHFNTSNGLPNNSIYGIIEDDARNLWLSSNNGISKLNYDSFEVVNYSSTDGLISAEYNQNAYHKSENGKIYFGGVLGILFFDPNEILVNVTKPNVTVTDFRLFNKSRIDLIYKKNINLNYDENFFSFELAAMVFDSPSENQYAYKLEGLNSDWIFIRNRRIIDFSGLNPGSYTLKVKAANEDDIWSDEIVIANIKISPPFWQTYWF